MIVLKLNGFLHDIHQNVAETHSLKALHVQRFIDLVSKETIMTINC